MATLKSKLALLAGLLDGSRAYTGPAWLVLDVTRRCNTVCLGCYFHCLQPRDPSPGDQNVKDLPLDLVDQLIRELGPLGTREVVLVGEGEPLLHPRHLDIIAAFKKAGMKVQLFTNGTLIGEGMAESLVESGLDVLQFTLWAVNATEHAKWHPGESLSYVDRRRRALEFMARAKMRKDQPLPRVNIQMILNRDNFTNMEERVNWVLASDCEEVTFGFFRDWGGQHENQCLLPTDGEAIREILQSAKRRLEAAGIQHNVDEYLDRVRFGADGWREFPCYTGWYTTYVKVDGTVLACGHCSTVMGNLRENGFADIWNGATYRDFRRRSSSAEGLMSLRGRCNCSNCCMWKDNRRVHRVFRWFAPLAAVAPLRSSRA